VTVPCRSGEKKENGGGRRGNVRLGEGEATAAMDRVRPEALKQGPSIRTTPRIGMPRS